jgi:Concanavalin A-like lectin/glucanases superfamily
MSFNYFLQQFDALPPLSTRATITVDLAFSGSASLITMFRANLGVEALTLTIVSDMTQRSDEQLILVGTVSVLGMTDVSARFLAQDKDGELFVKLDMDVPPGWSFAALFPDLLGRMSNRLDDDGEKVFDPHFLNQLSLGQCRLVFVSASHADAACGQTLLPGLNFAGELYFFGVLFTLGFLLNQKSPTLLAGPLDEFRMTYDPLAFTGIRLLAPIALNFAKVGPLAVDSAQLYIKSGTNAWQRDKVLSATQEAGIYLLANGSFAGRPTEMIAKWDVQDADDITIRGTFPDFALAGFANMSQNVGVEGLGSDMPEGLTAPEGLALTEFGVTLGCIRPEISALSLGVGMKTRLEIIPNIMTLTEIGALFNVSDPFGRARSIRTTLSGLLRFKKFNLAAYAELPTFRLGAGLPSGQTLPFGDVIESFIPGETELPALTITRLRLDAAPKEKTFSLTATVQDLLSITVGATAFEVTGLAILVNYNQQRGAAQALITAQMSMADAGFVVSGEVNNGLTLSGSLSNFDFKKFWALVGNGEALPDAVPDIIFETFSVTVNTKTHAFSVLGNASVAWDFLKGDGGVSTKVQFSLTRGASSSASTSATPVQATLSLQGQGPVDVANGFTLDSFNFLFNYQTSVGWKLSGGVDVNLFDTRLNLQAGYESAQGVQKITLRTMATPPQQLIGISGVGSYTFQQFDLLLDRRVDSNGKKKTYFDLRLASTLKLDNVFTIGGYLSMIDSAQGRKGLLFKPNPNSAGFKINFPAGHGMCIKADLFEVGFAKESASAGWGFSGTINLGFEGFPGFLGKALPSKITAKLAVGKTDVSISALNVTDPIAIAFPKAHGKSLGRAVVQLTELGISLKPALGLKIEAGLGLPAELNTYLGAQIFRTWQEGNPLSMARTRFTISGSGVAVQFVTSPFAAANAMVINGESWLEVDFGQYGAIALKMPTLVYDGVTQYFEVAGGFKITRTLALPLAPLKMFLEAVGGKAMADVFPAKIPLGGLMLVDKNGDLKIDEFVDFVKKAGDVPKEVTTTLKKTGKVLNRFPTGFKQYLNLEVPTTLTFKFGFSPTGRISIGLAAPDKPIRVLFPAVVQGIVPMPGLWGIEVRQFSVGTIMAGSLLYGEVDATIDQFDLPGLIASLMLPADPAFPLPTSDQLQRRITLKNVFCVIPVSAGAPIPIPLFYDEIGFDYLGIEGFGMGLHLGFPKPGLDGAAATAVYQAFDEFNSNPKARLDPKKPPGGADLKFVFHDEFLQAPEYLGGKVLGTKGKTIQVSLWQYIASLMNFSRSFSLNDCIGAIPLENRVGSAAYRFAFLNFDADWLLTTPGEFKDGAYKQMKLSASDVDDFVAVLPAVAASAGNQAGGGQGLVAFVRGKADLGFMKLDSALGLAVSGSMGFNTGFKFDGSIGKIALELQGAVMMNAPLVSSNAAAAANLAAQVGLPLAQNLGGMALALNGKNAWIEIPASDSLVLPNYTIELWIKSAKAQTGEWVEVFGIDRLQAGSQRNCYLEINTKGGFYHHRFQDAQSGNSGAPNTPNGSVIWDRWQHVALTNDGKTAKTFINGTEVASGPVAGNLVLYKQALFIGKVPGSGSEKFWKGEIGEIRIWKGVRDADDIDEFKQEVLNGDETNLVSLYRFDADSGKDARDLCGRNHGKINNGSFVAADLLLLDGLEFDGKTSYIEVPDSASLRIGPYTLEAWVKPYVPEENLVSLMVRRMAKMGMGFSGQAATVKNKPEWGGIVGKVGRNYTLILNRSGYIHHRFHTAKSSNDGAPNTANNVVQWNEWNHIAISNDGKVAKTYVNGVKLAEGAVDGNKLIIDNGALIFGHSPDAPSEGFFGQIAEVRLWSGARSAEQIVGNAGKRIDPGSANLVSLWRMSEVSGDTLPDLCGNNPGKLHMRVKRHQASATGSQTASNLDAGLVALSGKAKNQGKAALQVQGHARFTVQGHVAMAADLLIVDAAFWFSGTLDLFPKEWPIRVYGHVEGLISKQQFYLSGETNNQLFGVTLSGSRLFISNEAMRLEGQWLGQFLLLAISWDKDNPSFAGSMGFKFSSGVDFGAVRINGVKVSDNVHLALDIGADIAVTVAKSGFAAKVHAKFQINGKGFELTFGIALAPSDMNELINAIKRQIIDEPAKYLAHLFVDAGTWIKNIGNESIDFASDSGELVGGVLKGAFNSSRDATLSLMKANNYAAHQVGAALGRAYGQSAKDTANLLKGAGYAVEDVGKAMQAAFGQSAEDAGRLLKDIGYGASDVGKALGSAFGKSSDECKNLLKSCGFNSKDIDSAFKSAGKAVEKGVSKAAKKLKFW